MGVLRRVPSDQLTGDTGVPSRGYDVAVCTMLVSEGGIKRVQDCIEHNRCLLLFHSVSRQRTRGMFCTARIVHDGEALVIQVVGQTLALQRTMGLG